MKINLQDVFWSDLGQSWPPKVSKMTPKMAPQNDPKSIKNGAPKMTKTLIVSKGGIGRFGEWPGGLRGALGGKTRGVKNANDEMILRFRDFWRHFWPQLVLRRPQ